MGLLACMQAYMLFMSFPSTYLNQLFGRGARLHATFRCLRIFTHMVYVLVCSILYVC